MKGMKRLLKMVPDMMKQVDMVKMMPKSDSVCEKNDGTAGISTTNQAMVPETFFGAARDVLTTGAQRPPEEAACAGSRYVAGPSVTPHGGPAYFFQRSAP